MGTVPSTLNAENAAARVSVTQSQPHISQEYSLWLLHELEICRGVFPNRCASIGLECWVLLDTEHNQSMSVDAHRIYPFGGIISRSSMVVQHQRANKNQD